MKDVIEEIDRNLPETIQLSPQELIADPKKFFSSHIRFLTNSSSGKTFKPYWDRIEQVLRMLKKEPLINKLKSEIIKTRRHERN